MPKAPPIFNQNGFSLVEALLAVALFSIGVTSFVGAIVYGQQSTALAGSKARATFIAEEGLEAARNIRDEDFLNLVDGTYGVSTSGNSWALTGSSDTKDIFTRQVQIQTVDSNRKRVTSIVSWQQTPQRTGSVILDTYLTYWTKAVSGWSNPSVESGFDLTLANSLNATANPLSIAVSGNFVYLGRTNSAGPELLAFDVSNPAAPTLVGSREISGNPNDMVIRDNYLYIASTDNNAELQIVDISTPSTIGNAGKLTSVNLTNSNSGSNNNDGIAVAVASSYLVMVRNGGDEFLVFNLSSPATPGNPVGRSSSFTGIPTDLAVSPDTNTAFVTSTGDTNEVQRFNITTKTAPAYLGAYDLNSGNTTADALSVSAINNTYILVGRATSTAPELYIYNSSTGSLVSNLELGASVDAISLDTTNNIAFLSTTDTANDIKIVDISNPLSLSSPVGQVNINNSPNDLVFDLTLNRIFVSDTDDTTEFVIIKPN